MGLFDVFKAELTDEQQAVHLSHIYLARSRYPFCLKQCFKDNLGGEFTEDEKVCLAICVDKLHKRYEPYSLKLYETIKKLQGSQL